MPDGPTYYERYCWAGCGRRSMTGTVFCGRRFCRPLARARALLMQALDALGI